MKLRDFIEAEWRRPWAGGKIIIRSLWRLENPPDDCVRRVQEEAAKIDARPCKARKVSAQSILLAVEEHGVTRDAAQAVGLQFQSLKNRLEKWISEARWLYSLREAPGVAR